MKNYNNLSRQVMEALTAKFGLPNEKMFRKTSDQVANFFDTSEPRIKVAVVCIVTRECDVKEIIVTPAVEDEKRPGTFWALGDCLHLPLDKFPEYKFHQDLNAKLSFSSARTDFLNRDVLAFAKELIEKL